MCLFECVCSFECICVARQLCEMDSEWDMYCKTQIPAKWMAGVWVWLAYFRWIMELRVLHTGWPVCELPLYSKVTEEIDGVKFLAGLWQTKFVTKVLGSKFFQYPTKTNACINFQRIFNVIKIFFAFGLWFLKVLKYENIPIMSQAELFWVQKLIRIIAEF